MTLPTAPAELYRHGLRLLLEKDITACLMTSYRDYWNPLAVQEPGADFTGAER
ncbi:hypothetical protein [Streptomyces sp. NPDC093093]|uniref:hypothetical protein n=1 Tax=Streptomyces sp. NPDC093093 TaxID=3366025 RepID=UPI0037FDDE0A